MDYQAIGDIIISNIHRPCLHKHRRCVADVSPICRRCVWVIFNLGVHRRMFADCSALFGDLSPMVFDVETSGENFNAFINFVLDVPMPWRSMSITRIRCRSFAEPLVHGGAALAIPKFVHRGSIGRLKKPRGTVALVDKYLTNVVKTITFPSPKIDDSAHCFVTTKLSLISRKLFASFSWGQIW